MENELDTDTEMDIDYYDEHNTKEERYKKLGFIPQAELLVNKFLPYADKIDDESQRMLQNIKENLMRAVAMRELKPGVSRYIAELLKYIRLYGMKMSKEDHINFVQMFFSLLDIEYLEPTLINNICIVLNELLRKSKWLSPDDLQIDWKILYRLSQIFIMKDNMKGRFYCYYQQEDIVNNEDANKGLNSQIEGIVNMLKNQDINWDVVNNFLKLDDTSLETTLVSLIQQSSLYFSKDATQEILDELFPKLAPLDTGKHNSVMEQLSIFLPHLHGHEIWLETFINLWNSYHNPPWNKEMMNILAFTASQNIGRIDWEPYFPIIYTRIIRSFDLPVYYKTLKTARSQSLWSPSVAQWIASTISPLNSGQKHLKILLGAIESYIHPANTGKWVRSIGEMLYHLPKQFFDRVVNERFRKPSWIPLPPEEHRLTDDCITKFVESFKPIIFQAMYSHINANEVGITFKRLADLRPELILPEVIERVYLTLDSIVEPHKMISALQCLINVSMAMVSGHNGYTIGKTHVIPILFNVLPGIDSNDSKKTRVTLQFLTTFALLVPIVDCSKASLYWNDLTDEEIMICDQTAKFEDFVLQYFDKVFALIDASSQASVRMEQTGSSRRDIHTDALLQSSTNAILAQCSKEILASATKKFLDFVKTSIFEPRVAGQLLAALARIFSRVNGDLTSRVLIPHFCDAIRLYITERDHNDIKELNEQNDEFLYYQIMLSNLLLSNPLVLPKYIDQILLLIDDLLQFKCKATLRNTNLMIANILITFSEYRAKNVYTVPECHSMALKDFLPIRHWGGKTSNDKKIIPFEWYEPNEIGRKITEQIIHRYLPRILDELEDYIYDRKQLTREQIQCNCSIILSLLKCGNYLPNWISTNDELNDESVSSTGDKNDVIQLYPTNVVNWNDNIHIGLGFDGLTVDMPANWTCDNGTQSISNVRLAIVTIMVKLQEKILKHNEDDIKSLRGILLIWEAVHARKQYASSFDTQSKGFKALKIFQNYQLTKTPRDIRSVWVTRIKLQLECRDEFTPPVFTKTHKLILTNILRLATSHYSNTRIIAQTRLFVMLKLYPYSYRTILPDIVKYLQMDSNEHHEIFKGILHVINGPQRRRLVTKNDWHCIEQLWIPLLQSPISEKLSVVNLLNAIRENILNDFPVINITIEIPDKCIAFAMKLFPNEKQLQVYRKLLITDDDIELGKRQLIELGESNLKIYNGLCNTIINLTYDKALHWRHAYMASNMICRLTHPKIMYPLIVCKYVLNNLINELIVQRNMATQIFRNLLKQIKREHKKIIINPWRNGNGKPLFKDLKPGVRDDNRFLQYDELHFPKNQQDWDEPRYIYKNNGFFGWTSPLTMYAPYSEQPQLNCNVDEMTNIEMEIYKFFMDDMNIKKFIEFWSMEGKKGGEKVNRVRAVIIKGLANSFGDQIIYKIFDEHMKRLIENNASESNHRCAAEILCGTMRGMKHWPMAMTQKMFEKIIPLIQLALTHLTVDTDVFWGVAIATATECMDPIKQYWIYEALLINLVEFDATSFLACGRLFCLQGGFNQHVWRMNSVSHRLLKMVRPHLNHSFEMVRERLAYLLINIFEMDIPFENGTPPECPRAADFLADVLQELQILYKDKPKVSNGTESTTIINGNGGELGMDVDMQNNDDSTEYDSTIRLFKTVCKWVIGVLNRGTNGNIDAYFDLLPLACRLERCEHDKDLAVICSNLLGFMGQALTLANTMPKALQTINEIAQMDSWSARLAVLGVLQVLIFNNMSIILDNIEWIKLIQKIVLHLLEDPVLEVRIKAAEVLGGLIHCSFLPTTDKLIELFKKKCRTKIIKKQSITSVGSLPSVVIEAKITKQHGTTTNGEESDSVRIRHMGVLGLCAFISAYPYDIPDFLPEVFEYLGRHLNDPQPIPSTIRKTVFDFKRTHHDNWAVHQLKFTEEQLEVLGDLTIPPSYFA